MLVERVIGTVADETPDVDWVDLDYTQTTRRAQRLKSRAGVPVNILLPRGQSLRHGDLLHDDPKLAICVKPIPVLVMTPANFPQAMLLAALLGNQHLPLEIAGDSLLTPDDGPARQIADEMGIPHVSETRRFHPSPILAPVISAARYPSPRPPTAE